MYDYDSDANVNYVKYVSANNFYASMGTSATDRNYGAGELRYIIPFTI